MWRASLDTAQSNGDPGIRVREQQVSDLRAVPGTRQLSPPLESSPVSVGQRLAPSVQEGVRSRSQ